MRNTQGVRASLLSVCRPPCPPPTHSCFSSLGSRSPPGWPYLLSWAQPPGAVERTRTLPQSATSQQRRQPAGVDRSWVLAEAAGRGSRGTDCGGLAPPAPQLGVPAPLDPQALGRKLPAQSAHAAESEATAKGVAAAALMKISSRCSCRADIRKARGQVTWAGLVPGAEWGSLEPGWPWEGLPGVLLADHLHEPLSLHQGHLAGPGPSWTLLGCSDHGPMGGPTPDVTVAWGYCTPPRRPIPPGV